jgi:malonate-semialdehyde dehydrogenase (acetylating)/methylmalonate-semialdehyde dehydrogenase
LPGGVFNVVYGREAVGERLISHGDVVGVAFVGSTSVARKIYERVGYSGKRVLLQASAKNYAIVMPDADLAKAIPNLISSFYGNAGQRCLANSVLVPVGDVYDKVVSLFKEHASSLKLGYGLDEDVDMGPLVSKSALERVHNYIIKGLEEGARLSLDGRGVGVEGYDGYFIGPCIFEDVSDDMIIAREEIFGPVANIMHAESLDEAIELANNTVYGNASSIFTSSGRLARKFIKDINVGNVGVNVGIAAPMAFFPFGGRKESFFGVVHGQITSVAFFTDPKIVIERWW